MTGILQPFRHCAEATFAQCWDACVDAEAVMVSNIAFLPGFLIARIRGLPVVHCQVIPSIATGELPQNSFPPWPLGPLYNRLTHGLAGHLGRWGASNVIETWLESARRRAPKGARRLRVPRLLALVGASPLVVPRPTDWPAHAHVTGFWFLPKGSAPEVPEELRAFVEDGPRPVALGFSSMGDNDPRELHAIVREALSRLDLRAVLIGGSGGALSGFVGDDRIRSIGFVDYDWLFPRVAAVVHQGGAGTLSFCLTAGTPQVCVSYALDHRFWSWRMQQLGVAPAPILRSRLTARKLAAMIDDAVHGVDYRRRAEELAPRIRSEDGLGRALELIHRHLGVKPPAARSPLANATTGVER
jgi:sterol 3beta-glucosyltransferase